MKPLEFNNVNKIFNVRGRKVYALNNVSFTLNEGEVFGFVGPNGAGKSTSIKIMLDIINDYQGEVNIYGTKATNHLARKNLAYVPEHPALYENFTPLEILQMGLKMQGINRPDAKSWCLHWLEKFSVDLTSKKRIKELSKGNAQRVALAHALAISPKLLILDEPLSGLDPVGRKDVVDILLEFKHQGGAIFFTSHVLHDVEKIADRFAFINKGQLVTIKSPRDLAEEQAGKLIVNYYCATNLQPQATKLRENEYKYEINQQDLPEFITNLNQQQGYILSAKPCVTLESVFFNILNQAESNNKNDK